MKKILCLALCLIMACLALVGCDDAIGSDLEGEGGYYDRGLASSQSEPVIALDLYIITDADTSKDAVKTANATVEDRINQYIEEKYKAKLYIHYLTEAEYAATVVDAVVPGYKESANGRIAHADIVLINSASLFDQLVASDALLALDEALEMNKYGTLNADIATSLLDAARVQKGEESKLYAIPNNRVIGEYEYLLINRSEALKHNFSEKQLKSVGAFACSCGYIYYPEDGASVNYVNGDNSKTVEIAKGTAFADIAATVTEKISDADVVLTYACPKCGSDKSAYSALDYTDPSSSAVAALRAEIGADNVKVVSGMYEEKKMYELGTHADELGTKFFCNIITYPTVDKDYVFESAFAITRDTVSATRCMDIIYALNHDTTLRNLLQYGVETLHYTVEDGNIVKNSGCPYEMNILYTGNVFTAGYCDELGWTKFADENGKKQNDESVVKTVVDPGV